MRENVIQKKSFNFAIRIVNMYKYLVGRREFVISKQVLHSGTSIGANIEEALGGQSRKDFIAKMSVSYKEARETIYWLKLLYMTKYISRTGFNSIFNDCDELCKIISKILVTSKSNS